VVCDPGEDEATRYLVDAAEPRWTTRREQAFRFRVLEHAEIVARAFGRAYQLPKYRVVKIGPLSDVTRLAADGHRYRVDPTHAARFVVGPCACCHDGGAR
jgi:hypothetical protein